MKHWQKYKKRKSKSNSSSHQWEKLFNLTTEHGAKAYLKNLINNRAALFDLDGEINKEFLLTTILRDLKKYAGII